MPVSFLKSEMICLVMSSDEPGWFDQKVMVVAGVTPLKSGPLASAAELDAPLEVDGPAQAARATAPAPRAAIDSRRRRDNVVERTWGAALPCEEALCEGALFLGETGFIESFSPRDVSAISRLRPA